MSKSQKQKFSVVFLKYRRFMMETEKSKMVDSNEELDPDRVSYNIKGLFSIILGFFVNFTTLVNFY